MKKLINYLTIMCCVAGLYSCNDDFMQQNPIQELAEGSFLKNASDLPYYLNQLYPIYVTGHQSGNAYDVVAPYGVQGSPIAFGDIVSDNEIGFTGSAGNPNNRLDGSFTVPQSGTTTGWEWGNLKKVNYFLSHYGEAQGNAVEIEAYAAEAYFFKAWDYYKKLVIFGEVPWLTSDLNINSPELYAPRTPRAELADSILWCINYAVDHLKDSKNASGRINKDMANFLKARFCLFEGTFRKYHQNDASPMPQVPSDYQKFLNECVTACEALYGRYTLYINAADKSVDGTNNSYWKMFTFNQDPSTDKNTEAILTRIYDGDKLGHSFTRYYLMGANAAGRFSFGASKSLIDEYLCIDGKPVPEDGLPAGLFKGYDGGDWRELDNRDPRLKQTVMKPGEYASIWTRDAIGDIPAGTWDATKLKTFYPGIAYNCLSANQDWQMRTSVTGWQIIKHWTPDPGDYPATASKQSATMFRYGEVLLMLAEAKAELGTITNADLDRTVNALRERAGFNFTTYPNSKLTTANVPADSRLDAIWMAAGCSVTPLLREIRRERRVELAIEGMRREDLIRWKAGKLMEVPLRGMKFTPERQAIYNGSNKGLADRKTDYARQTNLGVDVFVDGNGFIIGFPKASNVANGTLKWDDKYYYQPIPFQELELNKDLTQSPGWEDIKR